MSELKRHIGRLKNTDRRIVVVFMQMPGRKDHALIVDTDALPDQFHEFLMSVVESDSAQRSVNLADVLNRRASPDAGMNLMNSFHRRGFFRSEPISNIVMFPKPNMPFPLARIIEMSESREAGEVPAITDTLPTDRYNQHTENLNADSEEARIKVAQSILYDAKLLEEEVARKRNQAWSIAPSLHPISGQSGQVTTDEQMSLPLNNNIPDEYQRIARQAQRDLEQSMEQQEASEPVLVPETKTVTEPTKKARNPRQRNKANS